LETLGAGANPQWTAAASLSVTTANINNQSGAYAKTTLLAGAGAGYYAAFYFVVSPTTSGSSSIGLLFYTHNPVGSWNQGTPSITLNNATNANTGVAFFYHDGTIDISYSVSFFGSGGSYDLWIALVKLA
jgi:hypothetical protein